jgi:hypothetical protein
VCVKAANTVLSRRKKWLYRFRYLPNTKLKRLHCSHYLPLKTLKQFFHSRYLLTKIIEMDQWFFLLLSIVKVTVNRFRYGIEQKNGTVTSCQLL